MKFPGGGYATISQTLAGWEHHQVVKLTGTRGALLARWSGVMDRTFAPTFRLERLENDRAVEVPIARPSGEVYELVDQLAAFVRAVRDGTPVACSGEDGRGRSRCASRRPNRFAVACRSIFPKGDSCRRRRQLDCPRRAAGTPI